jgi:pyrroline-5-carboxylate reductase
VQFSRTLEYLDGASLGVFGAGHLGSAVASCLLQKGFPISRLVVCHGGSPQTAARLAKAGLSDRLVDANRLTRQSKVILYLVRPQGFRAIEHCELHPDALLISFLAGTPLALLPVSVPLSRRVRAMTSAPETIEKGTAIGGMFPGGNPVAEELLGALTSEQFFLDKEDDMHVFTALGVCLPIVLACWRAQRTTVQEGALIQYGHTRGFPHYERILEWALRAEPRFETQSAREEYVRKAATPGGVTEAMILRIQEGVSLPEALESGVLRSEELSRAGRRRTA